MCRVQLLSGFSGVRIPDFPSPIRNLRGHRKQNQYPAEKDRHKPKSGRGCRLSQYRAAQKRVPRKMAPHIADICCAGSRGKDDVRREQEDSASHPPGKQAGTGEIGSPKGDDIQKKQQL